MIRSGGGVRVRFGGWPPLSPWTPARALRAGPRLRDRCQLHAMHRREGGGARRPAVKGAEEICSRVWSHSGGGRKSREPSAARGGGGGHPLLFNFANPALRRISPCRGGELQLLSMLDGERGGARLQVINGLRGPDQHPGPQCHRRPGAPALLAASALASRVVSRLERRFSGRFLYPLWSPAPDSRCLHQLPGADFRLVVFRAVPETGASCPC
ncbi:hypothetical protein NDU88_001947 [Pleurodeles waltl]|uniref:Uncharacterized protein n=1 Tax=Pleurodeles waltl TaxID=8319 RepID=A0AAV7QBA5_PLEWA|nr:hypothetical protein NDU88_001947 [Pleurodeles waltl]